MASVVISGDTSGSITLDAPIIAGSTTITLPNSTGNALVDIARSLTPNGYVKLSNGLIFQWGTTGNISGNSSTVVTFPIAFTTLFCAVGGKFGGTAAQDGGSGVLSATTTTLTAYNGSDTITSTVSWIAIGI